MLKLFCLSLLLTIINASETPIIGVLAQEAYLVSKAYPEAHSFITASTVKLLEAGGARVIPIWIGQDAAYYQRVINYTNGIVFPGGGVYFNESGGYGEAAAQLYALASKSNADGIHYPVWGICLGFQAIMFAAAGQDIRGDCRSVNVAMPLNFQPGYDRSQLFSQAPPQLLDNLQKKNLTYNYHKYCIFEEALQINNLTNNWNVISTNEDNDGKKFISSLEHGKYPFFGIQFHPEKVAYDFKDKMKVPRGVEAIAVGQYLTNFFVDQARKNNNTFPTDTIEMNSLIYNFDVTFSIANTSYEQLYLFKKEDYGKSLLI